MKVLTERVRNFFRAIKDRLLAVAWRQVFAYILMVAFICFTSIGVGLIFVPAGFIALGVASGLVGYLLGAD